MDVIERKDAFSRNHTIVKNGLTTFKEVGQALATIKRDKLYKEGGYPTFEKYCRAEHSLSRSYAYDMIASAQIAEEHDVPNAHVAKKLADVPEEKRAEVLEIATERMGGEVTGSMIQDVAAEIFAPKLSDTRPSDNEQRQLIRQLTQMAEQLTALHKGTGKFLDINLALGQIATLKAAVKHSILTHCCPACNNQVSNCEFCRGLGWVPQVVFDTRSEAECG